MASDLVRVSCGSVSLPGFWWDKRLVPSFQVVGLVSGVHDSALASGVLDAGQTLAE